MNRKIWLGLMAVGWTGAALASEVRFVDTFDLRTGAADWGEAVRRRALLPSLGVLMALPFVFSSGAGHCGSLSFGLTLVGGCAAYALVGLPLSKGLSRFHNRDFLPNSWSLASGIDGV